MIVDFAAARNVGGCNIDNRNCRGMQSLVKWSPAYQH